ncbi:unnamed protein product [Closterium sp. Yama58-4]|nr:unnamed protein product [Closterium sp. Yama58-4]
MRSTGKPESAKGMQRARSIAASRSMEEEHNGREHNRPETTDGSATDGSTTDRRQRTGAQRTGAQRLEERFVEGRPLELSPFSPSPSFLGHGGGAEERHGTALLCTARLGTARLKGESWLEKPGLAPTAANPSPPSLYWFGPNRHQPALNAFTRIRTPDRRFTLSCPANSFARAAEVPEAESANVRLDPSFDGKPVLAVETEARLLQSLTPPDTPSVAVRILRQAPSLVHLSSQNILAKFQYLEELVGKKAAASGVQSHPMVLLLSVENMQRKVAFLGDLIGQENAVLAVARFPLLLASNEENLKKVFRELVREVEEAMEESGREESGRRLLEEDVRKLVREVGEALEGGEGDGFARESPTSEARQKGARKRAEQGGTDAGCQSGIKAWAEEAEERPGSKSIAATTTARELVVKLVVVFPNSICYSWERNTRHKVEYLKRDMGLSVKELFAFPHFLGYSLERRIRPRHVALVSNGCVLVPHEVALPVKGGEREGHSERVGSEMRPEEKEVEDGEDAGNKDECGLGNHEYGAGLDSTQDSYLCCVGEKGGCEAERCDLAAGKEGSVLGSVPYRFRRAI